MQYLLDESEYEALEARSEALDEIERILNEKEEDEHGNSMIYSYRFDAKISKIMDVLDEVKIQDSNEIKIPWVMK